MLIQQVVHGNSKVDIQYKILLLKTIS